NIPLVHVEAQALFLDALAGVDDPEIKRKTIGKLFIDVFEQEASRLGGAEFLAQGTLYPDVIESVSFTGGPSVTIKSHHNVGGLPERMNMKLVEPLRELFKDEVRKLGRELGLPEAFVVGLRAVTSTDGMTADFYPFDMKFIGHVATRIINEVKGVNRVVYDVTSKPPGTIEWE